MRARVLGVISAHRARSLQPAAAAAGRERHAGVKARIDQERAAYRAHQDISWDVARAAALKANLAREVAWWKGLPAAARRARRLEWANRLGRLNVRDQQLVKATLADRRIRAGGNERARHDAWLDGLRWEDVRARSIARSAWFASLPGPKRQAYAAMWAQHRNDYGVPRSTPTATSRMEFAAALPHSPIRRDNQFLDDFLPLEPGDTGTAGGGEQTG